MNYFSVRSVGLIGLQGIPVEVECVQSRRLPYLQIIGSAAGASAELRERVLAAIESAGHKLPNRRTTVRIQPAVHGFPLENLDLAVALAVLAAGGKIPTQRLEGVLVCGSLGLDGKIQPAGANRAAEKLFARSPGELRGAIVPFAESGWLPDAALAHGGGFESLAEVLEFLGTDRWGRKNSAKPSFGRPKEESFWLGTEAELRMLEIAGAGGHHLMVISPPEKRISELAAALGRILPENSAKYVLGAANFRRIHGESSLRRHSVLLFSGRRAGAASRLHPAEELLLADQGVILVEDLLKTDLKTAGALFSWMDSGRVEWSRAGYAFAEELEAVAVAEVPPCECGSGGIGRCSCRPLELQNYRRRLERAVAGPFDLRCKLPAGERRPVPLAPARERIAEARERMRSRRGHLNGRLSVEALGMAAWPEKARLLLRSLTQESGSDARRQLAMARVAQTVCDLRGGEAVEEGDLLEAKHYSLLG